MTRDQAERALRDILSDPETLFRELGKTGSVALCKAICEVMPEKKEALMNCKLASLIETMVIKEVRPSEALMKYGLNYQEPISRSQLLSSLSCSDESKGSKAPRKSSGLHPGHLDSYENGEQFYILPPSFPLDDNLQKEVFITIGFVRKELKLAPLVVRLFSTEREVLLCSRYSGYPMAIDDLQAFKNYPDCYGTIDTENRDVVYCRFWPGIDLATLKEAVAHETYHQMQLGINMSMNREIMEAQAYRYQADLRKKLDQLTNEEREQIFFDEICMKDYSK